MARTRAALSDKQERILVQCQLMGLTTSDMTQISNRLKALDTEREFLHKVKEVSNGMVGTQLSDNLYEIADSSGKKYQFALQARNMRGWGYATNTWNVTVSKPGTRMATKEFHKIDINSNNEVIARLCPQQSKIMFSLMTAIYNGRFK